MNVWPKHSDVLAYRSVYGDRRGLGGGVISDAWRSTNLVMVPPFAMAMGAICITRTTITATVPRASPACWPTSGSAPATTRPGSTTEHVRGVPMIYSPVKQLHLCSGPHHGQNVFQAELSKGANFNHKHPWRQTNYRRSSPNQDPGNFPVS